MKTIKLFALLCGLSVMSVKAQTALPASCDFNTFASTGLPAFWTTNITSTNVYATGGVAGTAAIKFALVTPLQYVQVFTNGNMGTTTFVLKGYAGTGVTSWQGGVSVLESVNGTTWTTLATYTNTQIVINTLTTFTVNPNSASKYLKWEHTNKISGFNLAMDDANIIAGITTAQEINVKQGVNTILTGSNSNLFNSAVGTPTNVNFTIENLGTIGTLSVSSIAITGANASDYTLVAPASLPTSVSPSSNIPLTLSFNPSAAGTRNAILTITNNDSDEGSYVINLNGIGGSFASSPTTQASNLVFSGIKSYRAIANMSLASGSPDGYLIIKKESNTAISDLPTDGVSYQIGDAVGSSKVIYSGSGITNFGISNIYANKQYQIAIFTYNGSGNFINYNQTTPLLNGFTASGSGQSPLKYTSLNVNNTNFLTSLSALIYPHQSTFYGSYDETMIKLFTKRDTTAGQKVVTCVYSSENYVYTEPFAWGYMSREHSYCHNWMPSNPADVPERPEYNDQHHLFPTNQNDANAPRSNNPEGDVIGTPSTTYLACKAGNDINGNHVFEPRAQHKGDFARAVMYMATAYNGQLKGGVTMNWSLRNPISGTIAYGQDQNLLKKWHFQDLPDSWEISRNDFIDSLQGNRNPFIDSVRYACYIDFSNMTYIAAPTYTTGTNAPCYVAVGIKENVATQFEYVLAPNPTSGEFYLLIDAKLTDKFNLAITDVAGRVVYSKPVDVINGFNSITVNDLKLSGGVYFVNLTYKNEKITRKLIIQ